MKNRKIRHFMLCTMVSLSCCAAASAEEYDISSGEIILEAESAGIIYEEPAFAGDVVEEVSEDYSETPVENGEENNENPDGNGYEELSSGEITVDSDSTEDENVENNDSGTVEPEEEIQDGVLEINATDFLGVRSFTAYSNEGTITAVLVTENVGYTSLYFGCYEDIEKTPVYSAVIQEDGSCLFEFTMSEEQQGACLPVVAADTSGRWYDGGKLYLLFPYATETITGTDGENTSGEAGTTDDSTVNETVGTGDENTAGESYTLIDEPELSSEMENEDINGEESTDDTASGDNSTDSGTQTGSLDTDSAEDSSDSSGNHSSSGSSGSHNSSSHSGSNSSSSEEDSTLDTDSTDDSDDDSGSSAGSSGSHGSTSSSGSSTSSSGRGSGSSSTRTSSGGSSSKTSEGKTSSESLEKDSEEESRKLIRVSNAPDLTGYAYEGTIINNFAALFRIHCYSDDVYVLEICVSQEEDFSWEDYSKESDAGENSDEASVYDGEVLQYLILPEETIFPEGTESEMIVIKLPVKNIYAPDSDVQKILMGAGYSGNLISATGEKTVSETTAAPSGNSGEKNKRNKSEDDETGINMIKKEGSETNNSVDNKSTDVALSESEIYRFLISENADISILSAETEEEIKDILDFSAVCEKLDIPVIIDISKCEKDANAEEEWSEAISLLGQNETSPSQLN